MRKILWFLAVPLAAFAQLDDNTVTVTASRQLPNLQPDQAVIGVDVAADPGAVLDDVLAALNGSGITAANLSSVEPYPGGPSTVWSFTLTVSLAKMSATLATLQRVINASPLPAAYSVLFTEVSPELQATQQCPYPALVSDAQAQAQKLASAVGLSVGPILTLSDSGQTAVAGTIFGSTIFVSGNGIPVSSSQLSFLLPSTGQSLPPTVPCTMTVQLQLLH